MTVLPVDQLLAETIMKVFSDDSVSAIFGGDPDENPRPLRGEAGADRRMSLNHAPARGLYDGELQNGLGSRMSRFARPGQPPKYDCAAR